MNNNLLLEIKKNNALANGEEYNTVEGVVTDDNNSPLENSRVLFRTSGSAVFSNGSTVQSLVTDSNGSCSVNIVDEVVETIDITGQTTSDKKTVQVQFKSNNSSLKLESVSCKNGNFPNNTFNIAWLGASFKVTTSGGSGQIDWSVTGGASLAVSQVYTDGAEFSFHGADLNTEYTISGKDKTSGDQIAYKFTLDSFILSWIENKTVLNIYAEGDSEKLVPQEKLLPLYEQWGDIKSYYSDFDWFWTSDISFNQDTEAFSADLINLSTGETETVTDITTLATIAVFMGNE